MSGVAAVLHMAGMMGVWRPLRDYRDVNVTGTPQRVPGGLGRGGSAESCMSARGRSTEWTWAGPPVRTSLLKPYRDPYAVTKAESDLIVPRMIADDHLPAVIIRPGAFFGPGDRVHSGRVADRLRAGKGVIVGHGDNALPFVYATDVVQGATAGARH